jgi:predicted RNA-binding protein Jag
MLVDNSKDKTDEVLRKLAKHLLQLTDIKREQVLDSMPSSERILLVEMMKDFGRDKTLIKG